MVALEGHQFVGLVAFHHAVKFDALHHVREGVKDLVPPDERRGEVHLANLRGLAERHLLNYAANIKRPDRKVLLGLVQDCVVGETEGGSAILADEALATVGVSVFEDVDGAAMRTDWRFPSIQERIEGGCGDWGEVAACGVLFTQDRKSDFCSGVALAKSCRRISSCEGVIAIASPMAIIIAKSGWKIKAKTGFFAEFQAVSTLF